MSLVQFNTVQADADAETASAIFSDTPTERQTEWKNHF